MMIILTGLMGIFSLFVSFSFLFLTFLPCLPLKTRHNQHLGVWVCGGYDDFINYYYS